MNTARTCRHSSRSKATANRKPNGSDKTHWRTGTRGITRSATHVPGQLVTHVAGRTPFPASTSIQSLAHPPPCGGTDDGGPGRVLRALAVRPIESLRG